MNIASVTYITGSSPKHRHFHDNNQLIYVVEGSAKITVGNKEYFAKKGSLVILGRFEKHSVLPISADFCRYSLRLSPEKNSYNKLFSVFLNRPEGFSNVVDMNHKGQEILFICNSLFEEYNKDNVMKENMSNLLIDMLLITVYRSYPHMFATSLESFETVYNIQHKFETDFEKIYTLEDLSRQYNMSISYLSHSFKKITGFSVMNYLLSCRLTNAKKLLAGTDYSIGEIVELCGFSDSSNFARTFKEHTGISPTDFRKKYK